MTCVNLHKKECRAADRTIVIATPGRGIKMYQDIASRRSKGRAPHAMAGKRGSGTEGADAAAVPSRRCRGGLCLEPISSENRIRQSGTGCRVTL
jgi:hypothetical protein